jgi:hypothetical protein|eukprot:scaffold1223_cov200-Alexandrium_tamarense.AAC.6
MGGLAFIKDGDEVLANLGLENASYTDMMSSLSKLAGLYLIVSWIGLTFFGPQFIDTAPPSIN